MMRDVIRDFSLEHKGYKACKAVRSRGVTLPEILVALLLLGVLMAAFMQFFTTSFKTARTLDTQSDLLTEAQLAQQIMAAHVLEAEYVYPQKSQFVLSTLPHTHNTTRNLTGTSQLEWLTGTDPFLAMILPPSRPGEDRTFQAYYAMRRDYLITLSDMMLPQADKYNDAGVWVVLSYSASISHSSTGFILPEAARLDDYIYGKQVAILVDYVQPSYGNIPPHLDYVMFELQPAQRSLTLNLRMVRYTGKNTCQATRRIPRVVCKSKAIHEVNRPLTLQLYPRNFYIGSDRPI